MVSTCANYLLKGPFPYPRGSEQMSQMRRVIVYIDGFNLYHGLKDKYGRKFLWLDLEALCLRLLQPDQDLVEIKYFTAAVRNHPPALRRQQKFWNALEASCLALVEDAVNRAFAHGARRVC